MNVAICLEGFVLSKPDRCQSYLIQMLLAYFMNIIKNVVDIASRSVVGGYWRGGAHGMYLQRSPGRKLFRRGPFDDQVKRQAIERRK